MKDLVLAIIMLLCALIDGLFAFAVWNGAVLYGADAGAVLTFVIVPAGFGIVCLVGGVYVLIGGGK